MKNSIAKNKVLTVVLILISLVSVLVFTKVSTSPKLYSGILEKLDEKKTTVMELTAAAAAISTAITLMPDDVATPIADKIADTSSYFMIVLCVLFFEKYLITLSGYAVFGLLVPLSCVLLLIYTHRKKDILKEYAIKFFTIGVVLLTIIPASVEISSAVEATYQASIEQTLVTAENSMAEIQNNIEENEDDKGFFEGIWDTISGGVKGFTDRVENLLGRFIEAVAVLLVVNCIIPILAAVFLMWIVKVLLRTKIVIVEK